MALRDLTGTRFGCLTVISRDSKSTRTSWVCRCVCGKQRIVRMDHLSRFAGHDDCRCGPYATHGESQTREYGVWKCMIARCHSESNDNYEYYGGIGRYVCARWRESVTNFIEDMGRAPEGCTIDRIDTNGNYTCGHCEDCRDKQQPANCRWATKEVQSRNCSNNRYYTHDGQTLILKDWARKTGIGYLTLFARLERGWSFERAIATPKLATWSRWGIKRKKGQSQREGQMPIVQKTEP